MCARTKRAKPAGRPRLPVPTTAEEQRAERLQRIELAVGGICYDLLQHVVGHAIPAAAEPLRLAVVAEHNERYPLTYGQHLRELMGRLAELTDAWEYDPADGSHSYEDDDGRPYPAAQLFPHLAAAK